MSVVSLNKYGKVMSHDHLDHAHFSYHLGRIFIASTPSVAI